MIDFIDFKKNVPEQDTYDTEVNMANHLKRMCVQSATSIVELNGDVLRETFQHLSDGDLCAVADVCSTFKRNAQAEFSSHYRNGLFRATPQRLGAELRNFGSCLRSPQIELSASYRRMLHRSKMPLELIFKYCGEALIEVHFINFTFSIGNVLKM